MLLNAKVKAEFIAYYEHHTINECAEYFKTNPSDIEKTAKKIGLAKYTARKTAIQMKISREKRLIKIG